MSEGRTGTGSKARLSSPPPTGDIGAEPLVLKHILNGLEKFCIGLRK